MTQPTIVLSLLKPASSAQARVFEVLVVHAHDKFEMARLNRSTFRMKRLGCISDEPLTGSLQDHSKFSEGGWLANARSNCTVSVANC